LDPQNWKSLLIPYSEMIISKLDKLGGGSCTKPV